MKTLKNFLESYVSLSDKKKQLKIILKNNPANDENHSYHTWIRTLNDIKTFEETIEDINDDLTPDFKSEDVKKAISNGKLMVYSSKEINQGIFVTPSKMEAQNYAGGNKIYSKLVNIEDVAWIDSLQGQYAKIK